MAILEVQLIPPGGAEITFQAAQGAGSDDEFPAARRNTFRVKNTGGVDRVVSIDSAASCNMGYQHTINVTVPAGEERSIGNLNPALWGWPDIIHTPSPLPGRWIRLVYDNPANLEVAVTAVAET